MKRKTSQSSSPSAGDTFFSLQHTKLDTDDDDAATAAAEAGCLGGQWAKLCGDNTNNNNKQKMRCDGSVKWLSKTHAMNEGNELAKQKRHTEQKGSDGGKGGRESGEDRKGGYAWVACVHRISTRATGAH